MVSLASSNDSLAGKKDQCCLLKLKMEGAKADLESKMNQEFEEEKKIETFKEEFEKATENLIDLENQLQSKEDLFKESVRYRIRKEMDTELAIYSN